MAPTKDFSHLLRPEMYHALNAQAVPAPFLHPSKQPAADTPIPDLLASGRYRAAAIAATNALTGTTAPDDHARIFALVYTRLACLTLVPGGTTVAAQEAKALEDLNGSALYLDADGRHVAPWPLRVLHVRLHALGFGDPRRAVMSYYDLARECRARLAALRRGEGDDGARGSEFSPKEKEKEGEEDSETEEVWAERLAELGLLVAGVLVEMDDLAGATHHLASLRDHGEPGARGSKLALARALTWLQLGDVHAARACIKEGERGKVVAALCDMADGEYGAALDKWTALRGEGHNDEMVGVNMAVCLLYVGKMQEGKQVLEDLVDRGHSSHTLLFNLSTMYELCSDRSKDLKLGLAQKIADATEAASGWEKSNADFKL